MADNYNGNTKSTLKDQANKVKAAANSSSANATSINTAITNARTALTALGNDGTEIINTLDTGSRT